jgi:hypothetical protein
MAQFLFSKMLARRQKVFWSSNKRIDREVDKCRTYVVEDAKENKEEILTNSIVYGIVQCRIHEGSSIFPILSRIDPIARIDTYFFKIYSNIVLPFTPTPS